MDTPANSVDALPPRRDAPGTDPLHEPVALGGRVVGDSDGGATASSVYEAAFHASPVALAVARDPHCRLVIRNAAMHRIVPASLDWQAWSLPDGSAPSLFEGGAAVPLARQPLRLAAFRGEASVDRAIELRWPGRETIHLSVSARPLFDADGRVCGAVASAIDVGEARRAAQAAARRAESDSAGSRAQDDLLGLLGHELRNPMNAIATAVEVLERADPTGPESLSARRIIGRQTRRMAQLVADVGDVGRTFADRREPVRETLDLGTLLHDVAARATSRAGARQQHVAADVDAIICLDADASQLSGAVDRLIDAALREAADGATVGLRLRADDATQAAIEIAAVGTAGRSADAEPLRRLGGAAGLALARVRHAVEAHGGRVDAFRPDPVGSTVFVVRLPLGPSGAPAVAAGLAGGAS